MAYFTLATHKVADKNGEDADYIPCVAFGRLAELLKDYCQKGREVAVRRRIRTRNWADSKIGETIYKMEAVTEELDLMGRSSAGN